MMEFDYGRPLTDLAFADTRASLPATPPTSSSGNGEITTPSRRRATPNSVATAAPQRLRVPRLPPATPSQLSGASGHTPRAPFWSGCTSARALSAHATVRGLAGSRSTRVASAETARRSSSTPRGPRAGRLPSWWAATSRGTARSRKDLPQETT